MSDTATTPSATGYADVNGLHLYYEEYGEAGSPLVLLHGGVLSIDLNFARLIPRLVQRHRVIAVELQGHGRTADIDRTISPANSAADVVALLDHLRIDRAHVLGHSMGGAVAMELCVSHPARVRSVVPVSITVRPEGMHADFADPAAVRQASQPREAGRRPERPEPARPGCGKVGRDCRRGAPHGHASRACHGPRVRRRPRQGLLCRTAGLHQRAGRAGR